MHTVISRREKKLFFVVLILIAGSILSVAVIEPMRKTYEGLNQEIQAKEARLAKNHQLLREKDKLVADFNQYSAQFKPRGSTEEEMASVLSDIERIGKEAGVYLSDVKPQRIKDMDSYRIMFVEIRFQASMSNLSKFIYQLPNSPLLLRVTRLQINSQGRNSSLLEGTIQISKVNFNQ